MDRSGLSMASDRDPPHEQADNEPRDLVLDLSAVELETITQAAELFHMMPDEYAKHSTLAAAHSVAMPSETADGLMAWFVTTITPGEA
jgi:hypothetical protein